MKKVAFFFGAGAEGKGNFELPNGLEFMRDSYLNENLYEKNKLVFFEIFKDEKLIDSSKFKYSGYNYSDNTTLKAILKKWIFYYYSKKDSEKNLSLDYKKQIYAALNNEEIKELKEHNKEIFKDFPEIEKANYDISQKFIDLIKLEEIKSENLKDIEDTFLQDFINKTPYQNDEKEDVYTFKKELPTGISFILDGHFHTIIDPKKFGPNNFSKVFNYYWAIFMCIYKPILSFVKNNDLEEIRYKDNKSKGFLEDLKNNLNYLYGKDNQGNENEKVWEAIVKKSRHTYYHHINKSFLKNDDDIEISGVITSNYYRFVEIIETERYAYLSGQLKYFEIPESLEVIDITDNTFPDNKLFFPFIFGQSYIKPIVSSQQIEAFYNMQEILKNSNILVILGYNINEDDNHINSFIRSFVKKKDSKIIVISENDKEEEIKHISKQLRIEYTPSGQNKKIKVHKVDYKKDKPKVIIESLKELF